MVPAEAQAASALCYEDPRAAFRDVTSLGRRRIFERNHGRSGHVSAPGESLSTVYRFSLEVEECTRRRLAVMGDRV